MVAKEIVASDLHYSIFASSCDAMAIASDKKICSPQLDRKSYCYSDVTVSGVLKTKPDTSPAFHKATVVDEFCGSVRLNFTAASKLADSIVWATVDVVLTLTESDLQSSGDRLFTIGLSPMFTMKSNELANTTFSKCFFHRSRLT